MLDLDFRVLEEKYVKLLEFCFGVVVAYTLVISRKLRRKLREIYLYQKKKKKSPLQKLKKPQFFLHFITLISSDGFRFGYPYEAPTLNIHRLISNGRVNPVSPTLTLPNQYSIATARLNPESHGVI